MVPDGRSQVWKYRRRLAKNILSPLGRRNADVASGVCRMCTDVRRGLGVGWAVGAIWWRYRVDAGPEERRTGYSGWKDRDVTADGCVRGMSLVR